MNVEPCHILQCIYVLMSLHAFGKCHYCPGRFGVRPIGMRPFCAGQDTGGFSPFSSILRTQTHSDSQKEQLQRAGHEPVCLVPGSVDKYMPVPHCTLQKILDTHSEGFLLC